MASRGVRVITVYAQDPDNGPPELTHCVGWENGTERAAPYNAPLTSHMVMDPTGMLSTFLPSGVFPSFIIVDQTGVIYDDSISNENLDAMTAAQEISMLLDTEGH